MSKPRQSTGLEEVQNDIESLSEPSCSVAHLSALEHCTDVCEWTVSVLSWFTLGKKKQSYRDCHGTLFSTHKGEIVDISVLCCRKMQPMDDTYGWTQTRLETLVT